MKRELLCLITVLASVDISVAQRRELPEPEHPAVLAIQESNPTTGDELIRAIEVMMNLDRPDDAKLYLNRLLNARLDSRELARLQRAHGSGLFVRMGRDKRLHPEGKRVAEAVLKSASLAARDPRHVRKLIQRLNNADGHVRRAALNDLRNAHESAIGPLIHVFAQPDRRDLHPVVRDALVELGTVSVEPAIGALESPDEAVRAQVMEVLGLLRAQRAVPYLVRPAISPAAGQLERQAAQQALVRIVGSLPQPWEAERLLWDAARDHFAGAPPLRVDEDGMIPLWNWDPNTNQPVSESYRADETALLVAAQLASHLHQLVPEEGRYLKLFLATHLESAKVLGGLAKPLSDEARALAEEAGLEAVESVLAEALTATSGDRSQAGIPAGVGAAEVLGHVGDVALLQSSDGRPRALVRALRHPNRWLQFTAARAIMQIDPHQPYPGSSHLTSALSHLILSSGQRSALVAHPRSEIAHNLVGMLTEIGFDANATHTGHGVVHLANSSADYQLALIHDTVANPEAWELVQTLRQNPRWGSLPIGLMSRPETLSRNKHFAELDPLTLAFPLPHSDEGLKYNVHELLLLSDRHLVEADEQLGHAREALVWLARLAEDPEKYHYYDVLAHETAVATSLTHSLLTQEAAKVLGHIASPLAQRALVNVASQRVRPLNERQAAATAFRNAVVRHGILLTTGQIKRQYERYSQSRLLDRETQELLGSILDVIERIEP